MSLADRLRARIAAEGPLRFRDWMEACLYDEPDGYYMRPGRKTGPGPDADFATSPTLHPFLGTAVAAEIAQVWERLRRPADFAVVEFGGGEGDLARQARTAWQEQGHALMDAPWTHIERSPAHREAIAADGTSPFAQAMPERFTGVVVGHEFIDALPVHVLERRKGNWAEVFVTWDEAAGRFVETLGIPRRRAVDAAPKRLVADGQRVTSMVDAREWLNATGHAIQSGAILLVDYGDRGKDLWVPERPDATVRGFKDHQIVDDVLAAPGEVDITASVDFTQLREWAVTLGLEESSFESQEAFLVRHGALEALASAPRDTVEDASAYLRLKQLVMPSAMGSAFKVQRLDR